MSYVITVIEPACQLLKMPGQIFDIINTINGEKSLIFEKRK